jgi:1-acyl-sn-glycerol-3-phosphate acyltransferase
VNAKPSRIERLARRWQDRTPPVWFFRIVQLLLGWGVRLLFRTARVGMEKIPRTGPVIVASNHTSYLDPVLVAFTLPRAVFFLGKHTLFRSGLGGFVLGTLGGQIPVDRETGGNSDALRSATVVLERGFALGITPEGTRSPDGRLGRGRTGVAILGYRTGAPIYPVAVQGTYEMWPRSRTLPRLFRRTRLVVGDPIRVPRDPAAAGDPQRCREVTDTVMAALAALLGQATT